MDVFLLLIVLGFIILGWYFIVRTIFRFFIKGITKAVKEEWDKK